MKIIVVVFCFMAVSLISFGQETFSQYYENPLIDPGGGSNGHSIIVHSDIIYVFGNLVVSNTSSTSYLWKYDFSGNLIDSIIFYSEMDDLSVDLGDFGGVTFSDNHFIIPFTEYNNDNPASEINSLVKMDLGGSIVWKKNINIDQNRRHFYRKAIEFDNGYAVIGWVTDSLNSNSDSEKKGIITKTDSEGNIEWSRDYEAIIGLHHAQETIDTGMILGGGQYVNEPGNSSDHLILKTDNLGNELWREYFGGEDGTGPVCTTLELQSGDYLAAGYHQGLAGFGPAEGPFWFRKYTPAGVFLSEMEWDYRLFYKQSTGLMQLVNGDIVFIAANGEHVEEINAYQSNIGYIGKLNENLDSLWSHFYSITASDNASGFHWLKDFKIMPDDGFIITGLVHRGVSDTLYPGTQQMWLLRLDEYGCLEPGCQYVGIEEINIGLENTMMVYPNPVLSGNSINLRFSPQDVSEMPYTKDETQLAVFDALGREVHRQRIPAQGRNDAFDVVLQVPKLASGTYSIQWFAEKWYDAIQIVVN